MHILKILVNQVCTVLFHYPLNPPFGPVSHIGSKRNVEHEEGFLFIILLYCNAEIQKENSQKSYPPPIKEKRKKKDQKSFSYQITIFDYLRPC